MLLALYEKNRSSSSFNYRSFGPSNDAVSRRKMRLNNMLSHAILHAVKPEINVYVIFANCAKVFIDEFVLTMARFGGWLNVRVHNSSMAHF